MILVTGASGFVGGRILNTCPGTVASPSLRGMTEDEVRRIVLESGVDTVIHTAAISDIGVCQADPEASYEANVMLPIYLARASKAAGVKLICFSSDQVYGASPKVGPYSEGDECPGNIYAEHKLEMERRVLDILPDSVMLRAEWMYDLYDKKPNYFMNVTFAQSPISFSSSQYRGLTYIKEVVENMEKVVSLPGGAYNFGSETASSMYEITKGYLSDIGRSVELLDSQPRHNLWMNCDKARGYGVKFSSVEDALRRCAEDYGYLV